MLSDSYTSGYYAAYDAVGLECSLEKEAGVKDFMKKILLAGVVAGGGAKGAAVGGRFGEAKMTQYATENLNAIMSQKKARGAFVDAAKFVEENMSESRYVRTSPEEMARATIKAMDAAGTLPKKFSTDKMVRDWMTQEPYADIKSGLNAAFNPAIGAVTGERTHPSLLAHELMGHGEQAYGKDLRRWYEEHFASWWPKSGQSPPPEPKVVDREAMDELERLRAEERKAQEKWARLNRDLLGLS